MVRATRTQKQRVGGAVELLVCYAVSEFPRLDEAIEVLVGKRAHSSGAGFGERDLQFTVSGRTTLLRSKLRALHSSVWTKVL